MFVASGEKVSDYLVASCSIIFRTINKDDVFAEFHRNGVSNWLLIELTFEETNNLIIDNAKHDKNNRLQS